MRNRSRHITYILLFAIIMITSCADKPSESVNLPPEAPSNPIPADGASDIGANKHLSWDCIDPNGANLAYDLYFGTSSDPPLVHSGLETNTYDPGRLEYGTYYYWKIVAGDGRFRTEGPLWRFIVRNQPEIQLRGSLELCRAFGNIFISNGYLYNCCYNTLQIIDVMNPSDPIVVGTIVEQDDIMFKEVFVRDDIMYVAAGHADIRIYDVSNVFAPALIGSLLREELRDAATIFVEGGYAYIGDNRGAVVHVIYISNPTNPLLISSTEQLFPIGSAKQLFAYDQYAYVLMTSTMPPTYDRIAIVDLTDVSVPDTVGSIYQGTFTLDIHCFDNYLFVPSGDLFIFNISDPPNAFLATEYETGRRAVDIFIQGDWAYLALADSGVMILDVSVPESPAYAAEIHIPEMITRVVAEGNYIYLLGFWGMLYILEIEY